MAKTDEQIKKDVTDQLYWDSRVDASNIQVELEDGQVTLRGDVPSYSAKIAAQSATWLVSGVTSVNNEVEVKYTVEVPSDQEIKEKIKDNLFWNTLIDETKVDITVEAGLVTLEGDVDMYWKKNRVEELADVNGVITVTNKIAVVPSEEKDDKQLADDVVNAISRNVLVNIDDVDVKVTDSKVTLTGTVPTWNAYQAAEDSAFYTIGVTEVVNELRIE